MADTYTDALRMVKPADSDTSWGADYRAALDTIDLLHQPTYMYFVSPAFTAAALGNTSATDRRHFDTIQGAIDAAEGSSYSHKKVIGVYPGVYYENIVISGSIGIFAFYPAAYSFVGSGIGVSIAGTTTEQSPVITITQQDDESMSVGFYNICFYNAYNQLNVGLIDKAYLLQFTAASSMTTYGPWVGFKNCDLRCQTWGDHNDWATAIRLSGYSTLTMEGTKYGAWNHAGGELDGGIARVAEITNSDSTPDSRKAMARILDCVFSNTYAGAGTKGYFYGDNGFYGRCFNSSFYNGAGLFTDGGTGVNTFYGLEAGQLNTFPYNNATGVNKIFF